MIQKVYAVQKRVKTDLQGTNMETVSNAQKIKKYYKQILSDGEEHSRIELFDYAKRSSGYNYTDGMLTGALRTLVTDTQEYVCVRRGWYKKKSVEEQSEESNSLVEAYIEILKEALRKSRNITSDPFAVINMDQDEMEKLQKIKDCLIVIDQTIEAVQ